MKKSILLTLFTTILVPTAFSPAKAQDDLVYVAVEPCRLADTREAGGTIIANTFRNFRVSGTAGELAVQGGKSDCLDPKSATGLKPVAISSYIIAVPATSSTSGGVLTAYPSDQPPPPVGAGSTVNFASGQIIGNTTNVTLCDPASCPTDGEFAILARDTDEHVVIDVQGYFYPVTGASVAGYQAIQRTVGDSINAGEFTETVTCNEGRMPLSGTMSFGDYGVFELRRSETSADGLGWRFTYLSNFPNSVLRTWQVICADVTQERG